MSDQKKAWIYTQKSNLAPIGYLLFLVAIPLSINFLTPLFSGKADWLSQVMLLTIPLLLGTLGAIMAFGKKTFSIDAAGQYYSRGFSFSQGKHKKQYKLSNITHISLEKELRSTGDSTSSHSKRTYYLVYINSSYRLKVEEFVNLQLAKKLARQLATYLQKDLHDQSKDSTTIEEHKQLSLSLKEQLSQNMLHAERPSNPPEGIISKHNTTATELTLLPAYKQQKIRFPLSCFIFISSLSFLIYKASTTLNGLLALVLLVLCFFSGKAIIEKLSTTEIVISKNDIFLEVRFLFFSSKNKINSDRIYTIETMAPYVNSLPRIYLQTSGSDISLGKNLSQTGKEYLSNALLWAIKNP